MFNLSGRRSRNINQNHRKEGLNRGLSPEKILGATNQNGAVEFLMKWKLCDDLDLVLSKDLAAKYPQLVIQFYEKRLNFSPEG